MQSTAVLEITGEDYDESEVIFDSPEEVRVQGGWNTDFTPGSSYTTIHGSMTIADGTVIIENIILE